MRQISVPSLLVREGRVGGRPGLDQRCCSPPAARRRASGARRGLHGKAPAPPARATRAREGTFQIPQATTKSANVSLRPPPFGRRSEPGGQVSVPCAYLRCYPRLWNRLDLYLER